MASIDDVAAYILREQGEMSTWKLQKLVYYSQAWSLVWDDAPLFDERIEAWANGPVAPELYARHKGRFAVTFEDWRDLGDPASLARSQMATVSLVLADYGALTGRQLSILTHAEPPWQEARAGLGPTEPGSREITLDSMKAYYEALDANESVPAVADIDWSAVEAGA